MSYTRYHAQPTLRRPVVIAALAGWNDAADSATTAIKFLIDRWRPAKLAEIDPEEFFVFTETRPVVKISGGIQRTIVWPTNQFLFYEAPELDHDIVLYLGVEPQLKWRTFTENVLEVCKQVNASQVILLGALLADVPHSMRVPVTGAATSPEMVEQLNELDIHSSGYEGPTGMIGVLQDICRQAGLPTISLWAAAPHYLAATPNIKVTAALLTYLNTLLALDLDLSDIQSDAVRFEEQITALVARDPEASAYVQRLEEQINDLINDEGEDDEEEEGDELIRNPDRAVSTGPLPSADVLIRSVEELLRKERENSSPESDDDRDTP
jgi:proteasome assembly chaperone (PAC2) family protein